MKDDRLQKLIDWETIMPMERYAGGHDEQMKGLFKGAKVLAHWNEGDYQGSVGTAVQLEDGRYCWYQDSYGSCSGCDLWDHASDEDVRKLCIGIAIDADVFDTMEEMIEHMESKDSGMWSAEAGIELAKILKGN